MRQIDLRKLYGPDPTPVEVQWDLTYACQLQCSHCYLMNVVQDRQLALTTARVLEVLHELSALGTLEITYSGGDPFIRRDLLDIVRYTTRLGIQVVIFTSGMAITRSTAQQLKEACIKGVEVTLLGPDAETHEAITRRPGSFKQLLQAISMLQNAGVSVAGKTIVMKNNVDRLGDLMALLQQLGLAIRPSGEFIFTPWNGTDDQIAGQRLDDEDLHKFYTDYQPPEPNAARARFSVCGAGRRMAYISPSGQVAPCGAYAGHWIAGNLHQQTFTEIWKESTALLAYRTLEATAFPKCNSCQICAFCIPCPGLSVSTGRPHSEPYEELCREARLKHTIWQKKQLAIAATGGER